MISGISGKLYLSFGILLVLPVGLVLGLRQGVRNLQVRTQASVSQAFELAQAAGSM